MNYGCWTRGHRTDYDVWADKVNDSKWSYKEHLPYFKRTETHYDKTADPEVHGYDGPIHTTSGRSYPLREVIHRSFISAGFPDTEKGDGNDGNPMGVARWAENWRDGKRQPSYKAYNMKDVCVEVESLAQRILLQPGDNGAMKAVGVELMDGRVFMADSEVIVACGAHRTPQILSISTAPLIF